MSLPAFEFHAPTTMQQVFSLLEKHGADAKLMAGGTDVLLALEARKLTCEHVISLRRVPDLNGVAFHAQRGLTIKGCAVAAEVASHPAVRQHYPMLVDAIDQLATVQIRNKATVAGNLCNAAPCANTATPLMALGAEASIVGPQSQRRVAVENFMVGPGQTVLAENEVVAAIDVPVPPQGQRAVFLQHSSRSKVDISAVNVAVTLNMKASLVEDVHIFLGSVAPTPLRAAAAQALLKGKNVDAQRIADAAAAARSACQPITDLRASKEYRRHMVRVLTQRALMHLTGLA